MNDTSGSIGTVNGVMTSLRPPRHRVLIVEDEVLIALDLKGRLENSGYEVPGIAASADMAVNLAGSHFPDLILMDIRLQGSRDGIEAAAEVRRQMDIPVIFLTSHSDAETLERARLSEPFGYVVKPFGSVNFRALIEIALQKHETERSLRKSVSWYSTLEKRRLMRLFNEQAVGIEEDSNGNPLLKARERTIFEKVSLEDVPEAMLGVNQEGRVVLVNARAARLFGYEREALLGVSIEMLVPGHFRDVLHDTEAGTLVKHAPPIETERYCVHKDGWDFPAEISLGTTRTEEGWLLLSSFRDISERKRSEAGREQLAAIVNYSDSAIVSVTLEGTIASWNRGAERLYGYTAGEIVGQPVSLLLPPDRMHEVSASLRTLRAGGRIQKETIRRTKDGRLVDVSQTVSPIQDGAGQLIGASIVATDVSEHVRAEARFRGLLEASPDAVMVIDREGRILLANARVEKVFGYVREELLGQPVDILIPERFRGWHASFYAVAEMPPGSEGLDLYGLRRNGEEFPIEISLGPLETKEGILVSTTIRDITERKLAEAKIQRSLQEKDVMLNEIHHRVKNNLQVVSSLLSLQSDQIQDPIARRVFTDSQNRIQSMALIHQQLYLSSNFAEIDFAAYLRSLANHVLASYANNAVSFSVTLDASDGLLSLAEAIPCGLIVNELISNSLKHSFRGRSMGEIRIGFGTADGMYTLTVDDDGSPLPADLFANRPPTMGVRLVQALTNQLGGELQIGKGAKFKISFSDRRGTQGSRASNGGESRSKFQPGKSVRS